MEMSTQFDPHSSARQTMSSVEQNARWFVAQTQPHREGIADAQLQGQGFKTFLPFVNKSVRHARKLRSVRAPLFPSYIFISLDLDHHRWRNVN